MSSHRSQGLSRQRSAIAAVEALRIDDDHRMARALLGIAAMAIGACHPAGSTDTAEPADLVDAIDPMIGTGGQGYHFGSTTPAAARPFGLVLAGPDTSNAYGGAPAFSHGGGYNYYDGYIQGFSQLHLSGVGATDFGQVALMPVDGMTAARTTEEGYRAAFSHDTEVARAGYYEVTLLDPAIRVRIATTDHTALYRTDFPDDVARPTVLFDLGHALGTGQVLSSSVQVDPQAGTVTGELLADGDMSEPFSTWFTATFETVPVAWGTWADGVPADGATAASGVRTGAWFTFDLHQVAVRVATSLVDAQGAQQNLAAEHDGFDVDADAAASREVWKRWLDALQVRGGTDTERTILATALYHCLLMPTVTSDVDGRYPGFDGEIHQAYGFSYHTNFSLWDTYRTTHPLYTLLWPDAQHDMLRSLAEMAEQGGAVPRWPIATWDGGFMIGAPADIVFGEAWQKGLRDFGESVLFQSALDIATGAVDPPYAGRPVPGLEDRLGYYPSDEVTASASQTEEYALADHALAEMAWDLADPSTAAWLEHRASYWKNLYDPAVGFIHGRSTDGGFDELTSESSWLPEYKEGNARQYLWNLPHDPEGLFAALGGDDAAVSRLEDFFENSVDALQTTLPSMPQPWYWHGNEPDLLAPWLFALAGRPDLTRKWVAWVATTWYGTEPDGLAGNDDGGALSAWYVWASIGLYPLAGTDRFVLGDPFFDHIRIPMGDGSFTIARLGTGPVARVLLDGAPWTHPDIRQRNLHAGGSLVFVGEDVPLSPLASARLLPERK